jgi:hypothetical protein
MRIVENKTFDEERALYGSDGLLVRNCRFEGEADGESALKESRNITVDGCYWNLRYPFWHVKGLNINNTELTPNCRAALWYTDLLEIKSSKLHGIKALRECSEIAISDCDICSAEFGWKNRSVSMTNSSVSGEYFMLLSSSLRFDNVKLNGKYSFQYVSDAVFENCDFNTKDAFWHAKNVVVRNSTIRGEYLAWYAEDITFENCLITGTQPLCYCKGLKLINCRMEGADLAFEKSYVEASITTPVISIKNPTDGYIRVAGVDEIIMDDPDAKCKIEIV